MRKLLVPAVAAALLATAPLAFAAVKHSDGTVRSMDAHMLRLTDGSSYHLAKNFKNPGIKAGEKVSVAWDMSGKERVAESVTIHTTSSSVAAPAKK